MDQLNFSWPMIVGGLSVALIGILMATLKELPQKLLVLLQRQFVVEVDIVSADMLFDWFKHWFDSQPYTRKSRKVSASTGYYQKSEQIEDVWLSPAPGRHYFRYKGRWVSVQRSRKENDKWGFIETFTLRALGRDQGILTEILRDVRQFKISKRRVAFSIHVSRFNEWQHALEREPRPIETVILEPEVKDEIVKDLAWFKASKPWYVERGIQYKRGYLFEGLPGSGKTSLALALAGQFRMDVYTIALASTTDEYLRQLIATLPDNSMLLLEDIDAAMQNRDSDAKETNKTETKVTLSGLLNVLDGAFSKEGVVTIMTTNYKDRLDPALIRPGRIDMKVHFDVATDWQLGELCRRFNKGCSDAEVDLFVRLHQGQSMASAQESLMRDARYTIEEMEASA